MPASADLAWSGLDTEPLPFRIDEAGRTDLDEDVAAAHRIVGAHDLAVRSGPRARRPKPIQWPSDGEKATEVT